MTLANTLTFYPMADPYCRPSSPPDKSRHLGAWGKAARGGGTLSFGCRHDGSLQQQQQWGRGGGGKTTPTISGHTHPPLSHTRAVRSGQDLLSQLSPMYMLVSSLASYSCSFFLLMPCLAHCVPGEMTVQLQLPCLAHCVPGEMIV